MDLTDSEGELGIALTAEKQNLGYGTETVLAFIEYVWNHPGMNRIYLGTNPDNAGAIHVCPIASPPRRSSVRRAFFFGARLFSGIVFHLKNSVVHPVDSVITDIV